MVPNPMPQNELMKRSHMIVFHEPNQKPTMCDLPNFTYTCQDLLGAITQYGKTMAIENYDNQW